jgi:hypothetical protein
MIFHVRLVPMPGTDPIRALRMVLKVLRRRYGLRCISAVQEDSKIPATAGIAPGASGNSGDQRSPMS